MDMPLRGIVWWGVLMEWRDVVDYRYLAIITGRIRFLFITYIVKIKKANPVKRICPYKDDITNIFDL